MINQLDEIKATLFKYLESRLDLFKIETRGKVEQVLVSAVYAVFIFGIFLVAVVMAMVMLGNYLNEKLDSHYLGILILLGLTILKLIVWIVFRKQVTKVLAKIISAVIKVKED